MTTERELQMRIASVGAALAAAIFCGSSAHAADIAAGKAKAEPVEASAEPENAGE